MGSPQEPEFWRYGKWSEFLPQRFMEKLKAIAEYGDIVPDRCILDKNLIRMILMIRSGNKPPQKPLFIGPGNTGYPNVEFRLHLATNEQGSPLKGPDVFQFRLLNGKGIKFWLSNNKYANAYFREAFENYHLDFDETIYRFHKLPEIGGEVGYALQKLTIYEVMEPLQFYFEPTGNGDLLVPTRWNIISEER